MALRIESGGLGVVWKEVGGWVWRAARATKTRRRGATETSGAQAKLMHWVAGEGEEDCGGGGVEEEEEGQEEQEEEWKQWAGR